MTPSPFYTPSRQPLTHPPTNLAPHHQPLSFFSYGPHAPPHYPNPSRPHPFLRRFSSAPLAAVSSTDYSASSPRRSLCHRRTESTPLLLRRLLFSLGRRPSTPAD